MAIDQNIKVTADAVVLGYKQGTSDQYLLLIQRKNEPFKDKWAFPGGFVEDDEDLPYAAVRELEEETGISVDVRMIKQLGAWGAPGRDPRGRTITVAFIMELDVDAHDIKAADDAADVKWFSLKNLPLLAFDHNEILQEALRE